MPILDYSTVFAIYGWPIYEPRKNNKGPRQNRYYVLCCKGRKKRYIALRNLADAGQGCVSGPAASLSRTNLISTPCLPDSLVLATRLRGLQQDRIGHFHKRTQTKEATHKRIKIIQNPTNHYFNFGFTRALFIDRLAGDFCLFLFPFHVDPHPQPINQQVL